MDKNDAAKPVLPSSGKPRAATSSIVESERRGSECHIDVLYAEDDEVNAELVRQVASLRKNVTLRVAETGARALEMAEERQPDLFLVDMNMGDMTGIEIACALRANPIMRDIRLIALSADAFPQQIESALKHGFHEYLTKPVDLSKLLLLFGGRPKAD